MPGVRHKIRLALSNQSFKRDGPPNGLVIAGSRDADNKYPRGMMIVEV